MGIRRQLHDTSCLEYKGERHEEQLELTTIHNSNNNNNNNNQ